MTLSLVALLLSPKIQFPGGAQTALIVLRWIHLVAGITWVGLLYFFNLVNVPFLQELDAKSRGIVVRTAQLDQLLGPIALYPDPLIAEILPASTLPTQIVLADRYITGGGDPNQIGQQPWDASVQAVARYPSVLKWMDDNLNLTTELGQAFLNPIG